MESTLKFNFQKMCRTCKAESENLQSIYDPLSDDKQINLAYMLMECASIKVKIDDGLPVAICTRCVDRLQKAFEFISECQQTDTYLRLLLQETDEVVIKTENLDDGTSGNEDSIVVEEKIIVENIKNDTDTSLDETNQLNLGTQENSIRIFFCKLCNKRFNRLDNVKRHMAVHLKKKPHFCSICNRGFNDINRFNKHSKKCNNRDVHVCNVCNRGFSRLDALQAHKTTHADVDDKVLESLQNIEKYILVENIESKEMKELQSLDRFEEVTNHDSSSSQDSDSDDSPIILKSNRGRPKKPDPVTSQVNRRKKVVYLSGNPPCPICHKKFKLASQLKRHLACHVKTKPFSCPQCAKKFARRDHMLRHMKLHANKKEFKCDMCLREFYKESQLVQHKAIKHGIGQRQLPEKRFNCDICLKAFTTQKYRDIHVRAHDENARKGYRCNNCGETFLYKRDLLQHEKQNVGCLRKFLCSECGQRFIRKNYLVVHMRRHRGEKPYKCKYCSKAFPRSTDVTRHEKFHTGEKNHLCIMCGKGFGRAYNLTLHMRTHTGERPYSCTYCEAAFAQSNDLRAHVRRHTGERYYCDLCSESFLMGYMLKQHKRNVHKIDCTNEKIEPKKPT